MHLLSYLILLLPVRETLCGWVDPDTKIQFHSTVPLSEGDDREYELVFSDEFETEGRLFGDGEDSRWTALDKNDYTNDALHFYKSQNVRTTNGVLSITTTLENNDYKAFNEKTKKYYVDTKHVQSAMVQGWNKFCLTGGIVEFSAKLPGRGAVGGLWPALWMLGNLARATYVGSSDWVWPFSYNTCDPTKVEQQEINACRKVGHYGMQPGVGRGAPEIDILEAMGGEKGPLPNTPVERPYFSTSLQIAPGVSKNRPILSHQPNPGHWYTDLEYGNSTNTGLNPFFYGVTLIHTPKEYTYQSDAISANTEIDESYFEKLNKYRVEWEPPSEGKNDGYVKWYLNDQFIYGIHGRSLNITGTSIPSEPMYLIMNTAVATSWGFPTPCPEGCSCKCFECGNPDCDCALPVGYCDNFPATFEIDYVRVWQAKNEPKHQLGCSTQDRPTELFIKAHKKRYMQDNQREPLLPVRTGGASCTTDFDCGGKRHGNCTANGVCKCNQGFAGSSCLSHFGFDDNPFSEYDNNLQVSYLLLPNAFLVIFGTLCIGFCAFFVMTVLKRHGDSGLAEGSTAIGSPYVYRTYHGADRTGVASHHQKPVSYCLIDGRMID